MPRRQHQRRSAIAFRESAQWLQEIGIPPETIVSLTPPAQTILAVQVSDILVTNGPKTDERNAFVKGVINATHASDPRNATRIVVTTETLALRLLREADDHAGKVQAMLLTLASRINNASRG